MHLSNVNKIHVNLPFRAENRENEMNLPYRFSWF
jgi:hypothetical protein